MQQQIGSAETAKELAEKAKKAANEAEKSRKVRITSVLKKLSDQVGKNNSLAAQLKSFQLAPDKEKELLAAASKLRVEASSKTRQAARARAARAAHADQRASATTATPSSGGQTEVH